MLASLRRGISSQADWFAASVIPRWMAAAAERGRSRVNRRRKRKEKVEEEEGEEELPCPAVVEICSAVDHICSSAVIGGGA